MHNQQFSAQILRAPLEQVLTTLNAYTYFRFTIQGNAKDDLISSSFLHLSLLESLERLLLGYDYAIIQHRFDSNSPPSQFPSLMEVVILSRNSSQPLSREAKPSWHSSPQTSTQPLLLRANQVLEQPHRTEPLDFMSEHGSSDLQATVKEALQDSDPDARSLIEELLKE
ncbi:MAG: hypothetical protein WD032_09690 [Nitrospirales bacterium]